MAYDFSLGTVQVMGFMQKESLDIAEIVTESSTEPSPILLEEDNNIEILQDKGEEPDSETREKHLYCLGSQYRCASKTSNN